jgi:hypothetical protein
MLKTRKIYVGLEVLIVVVMKCSVFWDKTPAVRPASPFFEFFYMLLNIYECVNLRGYPGLLSDLPCRDLAIMRIQPQSIENAH